MAQALAEGERALRRREIVLPQIGDRDRERIVERHPPLGHEPQDGGGGEDHLGQRSEVEPGRTQHPGLCRLELRVPGNPHASLAGPAEDAERRARNGAARHSLADRLECRADDVLSLHTVPALLRCA